MFKECLAGFPAGAYQPGASGGARFPDPECRHPQRRSGLDSDQRAQADLAAAPAGAALRRHLGLRAQ